MVSNDGTLSELDKKELADLLMNMPIMWPDNNSNDKFQLPIEQKRLGILSKTGKKYILYLVYRIYIFCYIRHYKYVQKYANSQ